MSTRKAQPITEEVEALVWWFNSCVPYFSSLIAGTPLHLVFYGGFALNTTIGLHRNPQLSIGEAYSNGLSFTEIPAMDVDCRVYTVAPTAELGIAGYLLRSIARDTPPNAEEQIRLNRSPVKEWMEENQGNPAHISLLLSLPAEYAPRSLLLVGRIYSFLRNDSYTNSSVHYKLEFAGVTRSGKLVQLADISFSPDAPPYVGTPVAFQSLPELRAGFQAFVTSLESRSRPNAQKIQKSKTRVEKIDAFLALQQKQQEEEAAARIAAETAAAAENQATLEGYKSSLLRELHNLNTGYNGGLYYKGKSKNTFKKELLAARKAQLEAGKRLYTAHPQGKSSMERVLKTLNISSFLASIMAEHEARVSGASGALEENASGGGTRRRRRSSRRST